MPDRAGVSESVLTLAQWTLLARRAGAFSGKAFLDVGCGEGSRLRPLAQKGLKVRGLDESTRGARSGDDVVHVGSPFASVPVESHSLDAILFEGTTAFTAASFSPEAMIALANLGASLKPKGKLLIPVSSEDGEQAEHWKRQLAVFPGTVRVRTLSTGIMGYLTLAFLFGRAAKVSVIEFTVQRKPLSRLDWHRLAREAVMQKMNPPAAA